jgi:hypothetical protein
VIDRLTTSDPASRYGSVAAVLEDLDRAGADVSAKPEAWDRMLRHVHENATAAAVMRRSA